MFPRAAASEVLEACQEDYMMGTVKLQPGGSMISAQVCTETYPFAQPSPFCYITVT